MLYSVDTHGVVSNADFQNEIFVLFRKLILYTTVTHANEASALCMLFVI
jgi:hypothetical protein